MGEVAKGIPKINVALEYYEVEYQPTMIEFEGKMFKHMTSSLIDLGASLSYISPSIVELFHLQVKKFKNMSLVELTTQEKGRVVATVEKYLAELVGQAIRVNFNVLPLGS